MRGRPQPRLAGDASAALITGLVLAFAGLEPNVDIEELRAAGAGFVVILLPALLGVSLVTLAVLERLFSALPSVSIWGVCIQNGRRSTTVI